MKLDRNKDCCFYCERKFIPENYGTNKSCAKTIDHIIPISRRGNNTLHNKVNACSECNHLKANLLLDEFKEAVEILIYKKVDFYKTIPNELFYTIIKNIFKLIEYKSFHSSKMRVPKKEIVSARSTSKKKGSLVGEHLERMKNLETLDNYYTLTKRMQQAYGHDFNVKKEDTHNLFLMNQTPEQFELAKKHGWVIAKMITEPEPNFHYE